MASFAIKLSSFPRRLFLFARAATLLPLLLLAGLADAAPALSGLDHATAIRPFLNGAFPPRAPGDAGAWSYRRIFPGLVAKLPTFAGVYPGTNQLLIVEKDGRILRFPENPTAASSPTSVFLDIRSRVYSNSDSGMTYFAFHPDFGKAGSPNRRFVYVTYKYSPNGDAGDLAYWRLSRFTVPDGQLAADPDSELILIQQFDRQQWHDSGCLLFGPDGFLYVGIGDEGGSDDEYNDAQKINDRLFSGILRIDVDRNSDRSHPIRRQPRRAPGQPTDWPASFTAHYFIPNDNPFVNPDGSRLEEFYTLGHRNPYRFAFDPATGEIWGAEVGQSAREEVNRIVKGGNYGWAFREGTVAGPKAPPASLIGTLQEPLWDYGRAQGGAVVGGYFYYGSEHAPLAGKFLVVDNVTGNVWALSRRESGKSASAALLTRLPSGSVYSGTVSAIQARNGEVYFLKLGLSYGAEIYKLTRSGGSPEPAATLSATGAFADLATLTPAPGLIPYTVNAPLWSDGARKLRWVALPNDGTPDSPAEKIGFSANHAWRFPVGTVFVKHFEIPDNAANPASVRRLETRFLVIGETGDPYGITYRWRPDGSDADRISGAESETLSIGLPGGGTRSQTWSYPGRANCLMCHNANAKFVLGVNTRQLNGSFTYPETSRTANQLATLANLGFFDDAYRPETLDSLPRTHGLDDASVSLTTRIRSYLDANCAHCHRPGGVRAAFDARFSTPLERQGLIWGPVEGGTRSRFESIVRPGDAAHSALYRRDALLGNGQMPPLARNVVDSQWLSALRTWINRLDTPAARPTIRIADRPPASTRRAIANFSGAAQAQAGLKFVEARVNRRRPVRATGSDPWSLKVRLSPGKNRITIYAVDAFNRKSIPRRITVHLR